ncbi:cytochrome b561 and DOMON domain-containing protein At5g47530-like [Camellia sinensis]|uniref:DOMON domain-containing protein n=1 Tax=Camellia sinensis var. sinensis TaxID=542762 RepID=A0A4S4EZI4_CAMSN|nr:cytochrome b561 and DOMON domain-containing protein At5g47530-like [Camellia sinensis]THG22519.1 hypothetical protein TEA_025052 [Camellia sinensis var. sinensis]
MDITSRATTVFCVLVSFFLVSSAQTCINDTFTSNRVFDSCNDLPYLQAHLHWNYNQSTGEVEIAYRAHQISEGWIAWAINPTETGMIGSQALVAFRDANGSMTAYPTSITSYNPSMLPVNLSFQVSNISAEYSANVMTIFAVIGPLDNGTIANHVWQAGSSISDNIPQIHSTSTANLQSLGTLDFLSG